MRRFLTLLIAVLMLLGALSSCGDQQENPQASSNRPGSESADPSSGSEPDTEPETEPEEPLPGPDKPLYEHVYEATEDGSFTICGIPLAEYSMVLFYPGLEVYDQMDRKLLLSWLKDPISLATGSELEFKVVKNEKYDTAKWAEHEILFGSNFRREGMPEADSRKSYYGVTADGTVYFSSPSPMLYRHMWQLFLEEFFGVPYGSGEQSGGCAVTECYREMPNISEALLKQQGYEIVFADEFEGDSLNLNVWESCSSGPRRGGFNSISQVKVKDGKMIISGEYLENGEFGPGWYACMVALKQTYARGYFKAVIKCAERLRRSGHFWSAFWIEGPSPYNAEQSQGGIGEGGAEIDIMEHWGQDLFSCTVWVAGYKGNEGLDKDVFEVFDTGNDYMQEYHTFALIWDEISYKFYLDDVLVAYTDFGHGTSHVEEQVILSLEIPGEMDIQPGTVREMLVESVEIWQKPAAEE